MYMQFTVLKKWGSEVGNEIEEYRHIFWQSIGNFYALTRKAIQFIPLPSPLQFNPLPLPLPLFSHHIGVLLNCTVIILSVCPDSSAIKTGGYGTHWYTLTRQSVPPVTKNFPPGWRDERVENGMWPHEKWVWLYNKWAWQKLTWTKCRTQCLIMYPVLLHKLDRSRAK